VSDEVINFQLPTLKKNQYVNFVKNKNMQPSAVTYIDVNSAMCLI